MQWHRQEKNFLCSECGKKFTAKKNLLEHLNIHTGKRPFTCEHCNATFVQVALITLIIFIVLKEIISPRLFLSFQLSAYSKHLYLHNEGTKIHKCDKCHKSYSHAHMLRQHLLRHTGLRPFECPKCQCSFKSQSDLWCHSKVKFKYLCATVVLVNDYFTKDRKFFFRRIKTSSMVAMSAAENFHFRKH